MSVTESVIEEAAIEWLRDDLGYAYIHGPEIAPDGAHPERTTWSDVVLLGRFRAALRRINPHLPAEAHDEVERQVLRISGPSLEENAHIFHRLLTRVVEVSVRRGDEIKGDHASLIDFEKPDNNDWLVVNQLTVIEAGKNRRPDLVVYVNGLPLAVIELKKPEDENATIKGAWNQIQTYKAEIPSLFTTNEVVVISDGHKARTGSLTAPLNRFSPWRSVEGKELASEAAPELETLLKGLFEKRRFLDYIRNFSFWMTDDGYVKINGAYHQFFASRKAVDCTLAASSPDGDRRVGVVWHTQGSGKSISMVFYAGKIIRSPEMENPTLVVLTDRNDLDGQLFAQFCAAKDLIPDPRQADSRAELRELLDRASGGVIFTTIQKFGLTEGERSLGSAFPALSERRNIVVIADEAHRSQYGFATQVDAESGRVTHGLAANVRNALPAASFIGFTGTPIEFDDKSTPAVFGDYIDTYTIGEAVHDGSTVRLYYEARLARLALPESEKPRIDEEFDEVTEGEEDASKTKLKSKWARLEAMVGTERRVAVIAEDIVAHWERRLEAIDGKAMIVVMSRRIAVALYDAIVKLRPEWHSSDDEDGVIKVVMTGSASDPQTFQPHIRTKAATKAMEKRFKRPALTEKDSEDAEKSGKKPPKLLRLVIVRDMWLTGFDAPCAHTLYMDKPMRGHGLMQAIARVNRVLKDKKGGLVVDYLGLAEQLRKAVGHYDQGRGEERPAEDVAREALPFLQETFEVVRAMFHGFDYSDFFGDKASVRVGALSGGVDHIVKGGDEGKKRFLDAMVKLNKAQGLALHLEEARPMRDEIGFFQAVQRTIRKNMVGGSGKESDELDSAINQIVSGAVSAEGVIDIFGAAGIQRPDIEILSDEFLEAMKKSPHKNLQLELLRKLISDQIKAVGQRNMVQSRKFSEMLERTITGYQNRTLEAAEVILELIELANQMQKLPDRGRELGLTDDEMAFYDALADHGDVKDVMGDELLAKIAHDLVELIRNSVTIDWTQREGVRAKMRVSIKRLLRKHGYPPDKREEAIVTVLAQAERLCADWVGTA